MLRYRDNACGITRISLDRLHNIKKLGKLHKIRGYRWRSTRTAGFSSPCTTDHEGVLVYGEHGTARYSGVLWSYFGQGPRGLIELLKICGISEEFAKQISYNSPRGNFPGTDWTVVNHDGEWKRGN